MYLSILTKIKGGSCREAGPPDLINHPDWQSDHYLGSRPGFGSSIGKAVAPVGAGEACIGAGASLWTPFEGAETGACAVVVVALATVPVPVFTAVMKRRADSSVLLILPAMMSEAR